MAGEENLIPMTERTEEEARELSRRGGIASGKARRRKKQIKDNLKALMSMPIPDNLRAMLQKNGMQIDDDSDCSEAMSYMMFLHSLKGNTKMLEILLKQIGEDTDSKRADKELNFRIKESKAKSEQSMASSQPPEINIVVSAATPADMEDEEDED